MKIRGSRTFISVLAVFTLLFAALIASGHALAAPSDGNTESIKKQIDSLDAQLRRIAGEYNSASVKLTTTNELIDQNKKRMAELDEQVAANQTRINTRITELYKSGAISLVEVLLDSDDFMEMIEHYELLTKLGERDAQVLEDLQNDKAEQEKIRTELADAKQKQERLARELRYKRSIIDTKLRSEKKVLASLSIAQEMGLLRRSDLKVAVTREGEQNVRIGNFVFPVLGPHTYTDDWGAPRVGHRHQGTDVFALPNTPLVACVSGSIITTWTSGGGKTVYLDGDDGNMYVYMHCADYEKTAGRVEAGETIAYCGITGNATGYHLHFEVHVGGRPINPYPILRDTGY